MYRYYTADSLQLIPQHKAKASSFAEVLRIAKDPPPQRSCEDIIAETIQKAGLTIA